MKAPSPHETAAPLTWTTKEVPLATHLVDHLQADLTPSPNSGAREGEVALCHPRSCRRTGRPALFALPGITEHPVAGSSSAATVDHGVLAVGPDLPSTSVSLFSERRPLCELRVKVDETGE